LSNRAGATGGFESSRLPPFPDLLEPRTPISTIARRADAVGEPPAPRRGLSRLSLLGIAISVLAVAGVVWWALRQEPPQFPDTAGEWGALAGAIALYALATLVRGERWHSLLRAEGGDPTRADSHGLNVVGYAANNILPARAGDAVRVFLMAPRAQTSKKAVLGTLLAERLLDIAVILTLFVVVGYGLLGELGAGDVEWVALATVAVFAAAGTAVVLVRRNERLHALVAPILSSTLQLRGRHGLRLLAATVLVWALEAGVWMSVGAASGFRMNPIEGCYIVALASVFALIPSGPGYAGTQDAAAVTGIRALGGTGSQAVTYLILVRFVIAVPITVVGLALMAVRYGGLRRLRPAR
jgi:glycosyltransferase 2 family protein